MLCSPAVGNRPVGGRGTAGGAWADSPAPEPHQMGKPVKRLRTDRQVPTHDSVSVDVVIPVYNEERALPTSIPSLCAYLESYVPYQWTVTIADNASTDRTLAVASELAAADSRVKVLHLDQKG